MDLTKIFNSRDFNLKKLYFVFLGMILFPTIAMSSTDSCIPFAKIGVGGKFNFSKPVGKFKFCPKSEGFNVQNAFWLACMADMQYGTYYHVLETLDKWEMYGAATERPDLKELIPEKYYRKTYFDKLTSEQQKVAMSHEEFARSQQIDTKYYLRIFNYVLGIEFPETKEQIGEATYENLFEVVHTVQKDGMIDFYSTAQKMSVDKRISSFRALANSEKVTRRLSESGAGTRTFKASTSEISGIKKASKRDLSGEAMKEAQNFTFKIESQGSSLDGKNDVEGIRRFTAGGTQVMWIETKEFVAISFRGTDPINQSLDIYTDLMAFQTEQYIFPQKGQSPPIRVLSHLGMTSAHQGVFTEFLEKKLDNMVARLGQVEASKKPIYLTGHSLGGGLAVLTAMELLQKNFGIATTDPMFPGVLERNAATIASSELNPNFCKSLLPEGTGTVRAKSYNLKGLYTFGSPRVGDINFKRVMECLAQEQGTTMARFRNKNDLVTQVPYFTEKYYETEYQHVGSLVHLGKWEGRHEDQSIRFNTYLDPQISGGFFNLPVSDLIEGTNLDLTDKGLLKYENPWKQKGKEPKTLFGKFVTTIGKIIDHRMTGGYLKKIAFLSFQEDFYYDPKDKTKDVCDEKHQYPLEFHRNYIYPHED